MMPTETSSATEPDAQSSRERTIRWHEPCAAAKRRLELSGHKALPAMERGGILALPLGIP
jgi:hypothetical protein